MIGSPRPAKILAKIIDTLNTGFSHPGPGGVKRACQIYGPATGLDDNRIEAEPAGVHRGVMNAIIRSETDEKYPPQATFSQIPG
jgi:hypothetical protein